MDGLCRSPTHPRPHGGDGVHTELARRCVGYSQLDAMLGLLPPSPKQQQQLQQGNEEGEGGGKAVSPVTPFDALPPRQPRPLRAHAEVVMLVA